MKFIIPKKEMFGTLEFAGMGESTFDYKNGRRVETHKAYNLYSDTFFDDSLNVLIPAVKKLKNFDYEQRVELVNPRIEVTSRRIGDRSYSEMLLYADDIIAYGSQLEN